MGAISQLRVLIDHAHPYYGEDILHPRHREIFQKRYMAEKLHYCVRRVGVVVQLLLVHLLRESHNLLARVISYEKGPHRRFPANMSDHRPVPEDPRARRRGTSRINPRRHRPKIRPRELCCRCFVIVIDRRGHRFLCTLQTAQQPNFFLFRTNRVLLSNRPRVHNRQSWSFSV